MNISNESNEYKALSYLIQNPLEIAKFSPEHFTNGRIAIYHGIGSCYTKYGKVTVEGLEEFCEPTSQVFAHNIVDISPVLTDLTRWRNKRKIYNAATRMIALAEEDDPSLADAQRLLVGESDHEAVTLSQAGMQVLRTIEDKRTGTYKYRSTGFRALDIMLRGEWPRKEVSILSGLPGTSKTALVGCSMLEMAKHGYGSLIFSLEMPVDKLLERWISNLADIDNNDMSMGKISPDQMLLIEEKTNYIHTLPLYVIDDPEITLNQICAAIRNYVNLYDVSVVFIDHLQILKTQTDNRNAELGIIAKVLKDLAKALNIHVCIVSQVNNDGGIRDSGDVSANVDIRMLLETEDTGDIRTMNIDFKKNRNGRTGRVPLMFYANILRYE